MTLTLLYILLYVLIFIFTLVAFLLISPINYGLTGLKTENFLFRAEVFGPLKWYWFAFEMKGIKKIDIIFKIFGIGINIRDKDKKMRDKRKKRVNERNKKEKSRTKKSGIFKNRLFKKSVMMAKGLYKNIRFRHLVIDGRFGFDDPYHTGLVCALINVILPHNNKHNINLMPIFDDEVFEGHFAAKGAFIPGTLLWLFVKIFILSYIKEILFPVKQTRDGAGNFETNS